MILWGLSPFTSTTWVRGAFLSQRILYNVLICSFTNERKGFEHYSFNQASSKPNDGS